MANSGIYNSNSGTPSGIVGGIPLAVDADGGVELGLLPVGTVLEVRTRNTTYMVIPQASGEMMIWGHPDYCPEPMLTAGLGSVHVTGVVREGYVAPGMRLSFSKGERRVQTSRIVAIQAGRKN